MGFLHEIGSNKNPVSCFLLPSGGFFYLKLKKIIDFSVYFFENDII